jgi:uncharacterized membrane protein
MKVLFGTAMNKKFIINILLLVALAFFTWLMLLICIQYIPIDFDVAFLRIKQEQIKMPHYQIAFFTHVYTSLFTILAGFTQFSDYLRKKYSALHRNIGKLYIFIILFLAAPSGLVLACYAKGGFWSQLSFIILSVLWFVFTWVAFRKALKKDFVAHKKYMYYSYALTLSAITLRLWKYIIANTLAWPPHETYIIVSWLAWTLNLALAYFLLKSKNDIPLRK